MHQARQKCLLSMIILATASLHASGGSLADANASLVIQIGVLLFAVKLGGYVARRLKLPSVLGELLVGILLGPYALGGLPLPGFAYGLFGTGIHGATVPVSTELYALATIASIILLFISGLETDLTLFLRYSVAGALVGIGGVLFTFLGGALVGMLVFGGSFMDPQTLMLGVIATATSIGISARILTERKKLDTPEGVTILAAAVFDDVLGIVFLAVVLGINAMRGSSAETPVWAQVSVIAFKAFGLWLLFTVLGLLLAKRIAALLKKVRHATSFAILAFGLALLIAGFFEKEGLAMIIGAYVMGLSLSKTDISHIIIEKMHVLYEFFVPIFFAVMGMLVDLRQFLDPRILLGGLIYTFVAILGKLLGGGLPALVSGFNFRGSLRIGLGLVPRGEVVLILSGIGLAAGIISPGLFGVAIMMMLVSALLAPILLNKALNLPGGGTRQASRQVETLALNFPFPSADVALLVTDTMIHQLQAEGFYVRTMDIEDGIAQVRKDDAMFSLRLTGPCLEIQGPVADMPVARMAVFEAVANLNSSFSRLKSDFDPGSVNRQLSDSTVAAGVVPSGRQGLTGRQARAIDAFSISMSLQGNTKSEVIQELLELLKNNNKITDVDTVMREIMEREASMSTGMQDGIAIPHAKSDAVDQLVAAVGLKPQGMDFASLDGQPTRIIVLSLSPKKNPESHLQFLAAIGGCLHEPEVRQRILNAKVPGEVARLLGGI